ncbi:MAG: sugar phosphate isomerase/epimerase family protein [Vampirovibrionales bacterium]
MAIQRIISSGSTQHPWDCLSFAKAHALGFEIPSWVSPHAWQHFQQTEQAYAQACEGWQGVKTLHGPVIDMNPVSVDPLIKKVSRERYQRTVELAHRLGVTTVVFHTQWTPIYSSARIESGWLSSLVDYWQEFTDTTLKLYPEVTCVIENYLDPSPELMTTLSQRIARPQVKLCLDIGHVNLFSQIPSTTWLNVMAEELYHVHCHNNAGDGDDHHAFAHGTVPLEAIFTALIESPYVYQMVLELFNHDALKESYAWLYAWAVQTQLIHHLPLQKPLLQQAS